MNANQLKSEIKSVAAEVAGGFVTAKTQHHYEVSVEGSTVFVTLVFAKAQKYRPRARWRFMQLAAKLEAAGLRVEHYEGGTFSVSGKAKKKAA